ncbi:tetratricopeptide repeat protein [Pseudomonas sp. R5(2019)]|uniref:tetratricopeptide repeat protein n=1 Tax=Pseudomonas sp. R5(2019) TaxID=2697566 RepID=UPI0014120FE2|nr:tetratricopeptide repeat protein [Pseudomonas sp. R5(2019)]NBA94932.1 tetratricopeptide repeat protein [Pseudomonas sp. R5(2019)]
MPSKRYLSGLILVFCAAASLFSVAAERRASPQSNNALVTLFETASQQFNNGQLDQAGATLERALNIQPGNPETLHYLAEVRFQQGEYQQAEALATRSNMRVVRNVKLRNLNSQLIRAAQQAQVSGIPPTAEKDMISVQKGLEEEAIKRREAEVAAAEQSFMESEDRSGTFAPTEAAWESGSPAVGKPPSEGRWQAASSGQELAYDEINIPHGHWPPPGKCRIWFPDRPPGHQPAPGKCKKLQSRVPYGAYLVRG